jgi:hypothetical protein
LLPARTATPFSQTAISEQTAVRSKVAKRTSFLSEVLDVLGKSN